MKELLREKYPSILKSEIPLDHILNYEELDIKLINELLNETIGDYTYNTIDLLELLRTNYQGNLKDTINSISDYSHVRFNCYYATKILKEKLKQRGITSYLISYKSIGFSSNYGDNLIKEAHMSLLIPTIRNNELYYILLDPGLRIPAVLEFYQSSDKTVITVDNDLITIEKTGDEEYPYSMEMIGYNRYSTSSYSYQCKEYFSTLTTLNSEEVLFPGVYEILEGYRIINFNVDKEKWAIIKLMMIDEYLECVDVYKNLRLTFQELEKISEDELLNIIKPFAIKLNINVHELIKNIYFSLEHYQEFINDIINPQVLKEKKYILSEK